MFRVLEGSSGDVLGVEISQGYTTDDVKAFTDAFEDVLAQGHDKVNILAVVDELSIMKSDFKALWQDSVYALKHLSQLRHIAIVGQSKILKGLIKLDNAILGSKERERVESYFDKSELDKAWEFVRS